MRISNAGLAFVYMSLIAPVMLGGWCTIARCAPIEYKQTLTVVLREEQVIGWPTGNEDHDRAFRDLTTSADATRIGFAVGGSIGNDYYRHLYTAASNGAGLTDFTSFLPAPVVSASSGFLQMNDDGSRMFFRHPWIGNATDFYYCDTSALSCTKAVFPQPGHTMAIDTHDFRVNRTASTISVTRSFSSTMRAGMRVPKKPSEASIPRFSVEHRPR